MKKVFSWIFLILSFGAFVYNLFFSILGGIEIKSAFDKLAATPGASGVDYWGVGADIYILFVIAFSIIGIILSIISCKIAFNRVMRIISFVFLFGFLLPIFLSFLLIT